MKVNTKCPRWALPLLQAPQKTRDLAAFGGRGGGKSHFFAEWIIHRCVSERTDVVCIREVQKSLDQSVKKLLEIKIEQFGYGQFFEVQDKKILAKNGGQIIFQGMQNHTKETIKSLEGYDIAWVEEAQTLSQGSLDMLRPTIRKSGSMMLWSWNPRYETDPVDCYFRKNSYKEAVVVKVNYDDNPWLGEESKIEIKRDKERDPDKYAHIWLGDYEKNSESRVFKNWRIEEFETPANAEFKFGADWGFANDPTVLVRCYLEGRKLYIDYEAYKIGAEILDTPDLFLTVPESELWTIVADSSRPETISHMRSHGFSKIVGALKGKDSVKEGVEWLKTYDIIVHPRCVKTIDELSLYSYKQDPHTLEILPKFKDDHNHVIDALRYAVENIRRLSVSTEKISFTKTQSNWLGA